MSNEDAAQKLWAESQPAALSKVDDYLISRGIDPPKPMPQCLRFAPNLKHPDEYYFPALLVQATNSETGAPTGGIQRIFLARSGKGKAPVERNKQKMALGPTKGGVARLGEPVDGEPLIIGESFEDVLTAMEASGLPGWSTFGTSGLRSLMTPDAVKWVTILAQNDRPSEKAILVIIPLLRERGVKVGVAKPPPGVKDFNDLANGTSGHTPEAGLAIVRAAIDKAKTSAKDEPADDEADDDEPSSENKFSLTENGLFQRKGDRLEWISQSFKVLGLAREAASDNGAAGGWGTGGPRIIGACSRFPLARTRSPSGSVRRAKGVRRARAGQLVRAIDVPVRQAFGVFDRPSLDFDLKAFADQMKLAASTSYGTAGPEFVRLLIEARVGRQEVREIANDFVEKALAGVSGDLGQAKRVAERFGLVAAAGELAVEFGLVAWPKGASMGDAEALFRRWLDARGGTGPAEIKLMIAQIRRFLELHGDARFDDADPPPKNAIGGEEFERRPVSNRAGYRMGEGGNRRWYILPEVWRQEICTGLDHTEVARVLCELSMLEKGEGRNYAKKARIPGPGPQRFYVLTPAIFEG
jgi:hypothetical protein